MSQVQFVVKLLTALGVSVYEAKKASSGVSFLLPANNQNTRNRLGAWCWRCHPADCLKVKRGGVKRIKKCINPQTE